MDIRALVASGLHVRGDRPAARSGLADGEAVSRGGRAAGLPPQADAVEAGSVQAVDRSVAGGATGVVGDAGCIRTWSAITGSRAAITLSVATSSGRGRRRAPRSEVRFETRPGFQAQVDWSHEQPIRTSSGLELPLYCFHMVLGHSRDSFCRLTGSQDLVTFWACHRAAFAHFGGVPRELLYDRTKTVVRQHVGRDVSIERADLSSRGAGVRASLRVLDAALPGLPGKDQGQGRARRPRRSGSGCCAGTASRATRRRTSAGRPGTRRSPASACTARTARSSSSVRERDRAALLPLPPTSYLVVERTSRVVARDGFFSFEGRRYHVPDAKPGERVELVLRRHRARGPLAARRSAARAS